MSSILTFVVDTATRVIILVWDVSLTAINIITPSRRVGSVIAQGYPGAGGTWPAFIPPGEHDSRSACPALNAMANHGLLPRDGRNITFKQMNTACRTAFNFAPTFCFVVPNFSAKMLKKSYWTGTFDLADLSVHNGIEHDASLTRQDTHIQPDQSKPHPPLIQELLASATAKDTDGTPKLTLEDLSRSTSKRRADSQASNPTYSTSLFHRAFGSTNTSFLVTCYGGRVDQLQELLVNERIPEGWEPVVRKPMGFTISSFALSALKVELGVKGTKAG